MAQTIAFMLFHRVFGLIFTIFTGIGFLSILTFQPDFFYNLIFFYICFILMGLWLSYYNELERARKKFKKILKNNKKKKVRTQC